MVRSGSKLFAWACEHNMGLKPVECENIIRTKEFMAALRAARNVFYKELATDPTRSRTTAIGQLLFAIQKLLEADQYDKAVTAIGQLFKAEGWTQDQASISIFNEISGKDIDAIRKRLQGPKAGLLPTDAN